MLVAGRDGHPHEYITVKVCKINLRSVERIRTESEKSSRLIIRDPGYVCGIACSNIVL